MVSKKILLNLLKIFENSKFDDLEPIFYDGNFEEIRKIYSDINGKLSKFQKKKKKADKFNVEEYFKILKLRIIFGENWYKKKEIKLEKVIYKTLNEKLEIIEIKIKDFINNKDEIRKKIYDTI